MRLNSIDLLILEKIYDNITEYDCNNTFDDLLFDVFQQDYVYYYQFQTDKIFYEHFGTLSFIYKEYMKEIGETLDPFDTFEIVNTLVCFRAYYTINYLIDTDKCLDEVYLTEEVIQEIKTKIDEILK